MVISRFRVDEADVDDFRRAASTAAAVLAASTGYLDGAIGRNVDDPGLWVLQTRWKNVGSYRRALSSYDVKVHAVALLARAIDEPSAYELVGTDEETMSPKEMNRAVPRSLD